MYQGGYISGFFARLPRLASHLTALATNLLLRPVLEFPTLVAWALATSRVSLLRLLLSKPLRPTIKAVTEFVLTHRLFAQTSFAQRFLHDTVGSISSTLVPSRLRPLTHFNMSFAINCGVSGQP